MKITEMKVNGVIHPLGYDCHQPSFTWCCGEYSKEDSVHFQFVLSLDDAFNEISYQSEIGEALDPLGYTPPSMLYQARTRYYWKIIAQKDGQIISEAVSWFESGKHQEAWQANWVYYPTDQESIQYVKDFEVTTQIKQARIYMCALGLFKLFLNDQEVTDELLSPGFTPYDSYAQIVTYDLTEQLILGHNQIRVVVGNGWWKGRFGFDGGEQSIYGDDLILRSEIVLKDFDDRTKVILSDTSWIAQASVIKENSIYDGEFHDSTVETRTLGSCAIYPKQASVPTLVDRIGQPVKVMETIPLSPDMVVENDALILDIGRNISGWVSFNPTKLPEGTEMCVQYAELLQEQAFYQGNLRTAKQTFTYKTHQETTIVRPYFTYFGFQFIRVSGISATAFFALEPTVEIIYSEMTDTGSIYTGHPKINQLFRNIKNSQIANFIDIPTDCPQRDERMGWTGDAQIFAKTASYNMDTKSFFAKFLKDLRAEQRKLNGSVPYVVPQIKPKKISLYSCDGSAVWGDAATVIPWRLYEMYGDKSLLRTHYAMMKDWVEYIIRETAETETPNLWQTGIHLGDWLALDTQDPMGVMGQTDPYFIASAYYYYSTQILSKAAAVLGYQEDARKYEYKQQKIRAAFQARYFTRDGHLAVDTQTAFSLVFYFKLFEESNFDILVDSFKKRMLKDNVHLTTGFAGTPYLLPALSIAGLDQYAYAIFLSEDYPSWLYCVNLGATSMWERWNSILPDRQINPEGMNSLNHYAFGSVGEWMYEWMCGISPMEEQPGFRSFLFKPRVDPRVGFAKCTLQSTSGQIATSWQFVNNHQLKMTLDFVGPATCKVDFRHLEPQTITVNGNNKNSTAFELSAGTHHIQVETALFDQPLSVRSTVEALVLVPEAKKTIDKYIRLATSQLMISDTREKCIAELLDYTLLGHKLTDDVFTAIDERLNK